MWQRTNASVREQRDWSEFYRLFQGENFLTGLTASMYNVSVGEGMCSDVIVTDDSITCRPPASEPGTGAESKPRVQVTQVT